MKLIPFANATAFVFGLIYIICALGIAFARDFYVAFVNSFFHGIDMAALPVKEMTLSAIVVGFIAVVALTWILGLLFAHCYNWCDKRFGK